MKKVVFLILAICLHAFLTLFSFGMMFGMAHMQAEDRPRAPQILWGSIALVTWQPLLLLTYDKIRIGRRRVFDSHPIPIVILNSSAAVGLGYTGFLVVRNIRDRRRKNKES